MSQKFAQATGIGPVNQITTATGGLRVVGYAELLCQAYLLLTASPADGVQFLSLHPTPLFRHGRLEEFGRERPEQVAPQATFALDDVERGSHLALGSLADHLTGENEVVIVGLHPGLRLAQQEDAAVHAGIHPRSIPVARVEHQREVLIGDVNHLQAHSEHRNRSLSVGRPGRPASGHAPPPGKGEASAEMQRSDLDPLLEHDPDSQGAIEPTREQAHRFDLFLIVHRWEGYHRAGKPSTCAVVRYKRQGKSGMDDTNTRTVVPLYW